MTLYDALSIWEIAHRWHKQDPNITNPDVLPLEVQDTLRFLTRKMAYHDLPSCSPKGVKYTTEADIEDRETVWSWRENADNLKIGEKETIYENYLGDMDKRVQRHNECVENFELCYEKRIYDKNKLDSTFTLQDELAKLCIEHNIQLPDFWYPKDWNSNTNNDDKKLRPNQIDKQLCQAIASTLWNEFPNYNIKQIITHPSLRRFGNGAQYEERTLRGWVKGRDPRPEDARRGRPKK